MRLINSQHYNHGSDNMDEVSTNATLMKCWQVLACVDDIYKHIICNNMYAIYNTFFGIRVLLAAHILIPN